MVRPVVQHACLVAVEASQATQKAAGLPESGVDQVILAFEDCLDSVAVILAQMGAEVEKVLPYLRWVVWDLELVALGAAVRASPLDSARQTRGAPEQGPWCTSDRS